jgi:DNA-binding GntR family transcriptional regulator
MDQDNPEHRKYMLVVTSLMEEIRSGLRVPGDKVPSIADLCQTYGVSRQTGVRR